MIRLMLFVISSSGDRVWGLRWGYSVGADLLPCCRVVGTGIAAGGGGSIANDIAGGGGRYFGDWGKGVGDFIFGICHTVVCITPRTAGRRGLLAA